MTGTAILMQEKRNVIVLENLDQTAIQEIKNQCNCTHCNCHVEKDRIIDLGRVSMIGVKTDEIDWEYGY